MELVDFGVFLTTIPDAVRLLIIPVFAWIAWRDIRTRRVPNKVWLPLIVIGLGLFLWEAWSVMGTSQWRFFATPASMSIFVMIPAAYLLWSIGAFGGADAKAIMVLSIFFPTYPEYFRGSEAYPIVESTIGSFSFTILSNAVALAVMIPVALVLINLAHGRVSKVMFLGLKHQVSEIESMPGKLLEDPDGLTRSGLDLDTLRMYLRWRDTTVEAIRNDTRAFRHPSTVPEMGSDPTDGAIRTDGGVAAEEAPTDSVDDSEEEVSPEEDTEVPEDAGDEEYVDNSTDGRETDSDCDADWWGAEAFLDEADYAYGTSVEELRDGLDVIVEQDTVWVSPGTPFMVPLFLGIIVAIGYGNLIFAGMAAVGLV